MSDRQTIRIRFPGMELGDAGMAAESLREQIEDETSEVDVGVEKDNPDTMDFGATLAIVLGTPAALALAKGIANWMARERSAIEIEIGSEKVTVKASGTINENVARIVEAVQRAEQS